VSKTQTIIIGSERQSEKGRRQEINNKSAACYSILYFLLLVKKMVFRLYITRGSVMVRHKLQILLQIADINLSTCKTNHVIAYQSCL